MTDDIAKRRAVLWWTLTIIVAIAFFAVALSNAVYETTSPAGPFQILLRKSYSVGAFAIVGYLFSRALMASERTKTAGYVATAVAAYSLSIEVGQALAGSHEGLMWNGIDVACGLVGGYLGALARAGLG